MTTWSTGRSAPAPNLRRQTDITEQPTAEGTARSPAASRRAPWCTPTAAVNSAPTPSSALGRTTPDRLDGQGWRSSPGPTAHHPAAAASRPSTARRRPPPQPRSGHLTDESTGGAPTAGGLQPGGADLTARLSAVPGCRCSAGRRVAAVGGQPGRRMFRFGMPRDARDRVPWLRVWIIRSAALASRASQPPVQQPMTSEATS